MSSAPARPPRSQITSRMKPGSGRAVPVSFGWRMPMWDPDGLPVGSWLPAVHENLDALRGKFDAVWLSDHFVPGNTWKSPDTDTLECWTTTAAMSMRHPDYRFGQIVMGNSYRYPPLLAKSAATLQVLTGGRLILGLGAGWMESEYRAYGYEFSSPAVRLAQLAESIRLMRRMWRSSPASFEGKYYTIKDAWCLPRPEPAPPIMIGSGGEQIALKLVARHADWWNLSDITPPEFARKCSILEQHCRNEGRDPTSILYTYQSQALAIAPSETEARAMAARSALAQNARPDTVIAGTPDQVAARLREYVELGVRHFLLRFLDFPRVDGAQLFAKEVAPQLN